MGLFGSLIGFDQLSGANNAVMANYLLENGDPTLAIIAKDVVERILMGTQHNPLDFTLERINQESRIVQMNFIALSFDYFDINPFKGQVWWRLNNPYALRGKVNNMHIEAAIKGITKSSGYQVTWPGDDKRINFKKLYETGSL